LVLEGERIERRAPLNGSTAQHSAGHYVLASYRLRHVQLVVKWEQLRDVSTEAGGSTSRTRMTWTTYGLNLLSSGDNVRLQSNWIVKEERPTDTGNQLVVQLIVIF
jgi:hypothetical protein